MIGSRLLILVGAALAVGACGKIFPFGERLLPESYGPPFGSALKANLPKHPHNPAKDERHAAADSAESRRYASHQACHAALAATVAAHGANGRVERISAIESIGLYEAGGVIHEQRCSDYVLSHRSWCAAGGAHASASGHIDAHKRAEPECGGDTTGH